MRMYYDIILWNDVEDVNAIKEVYAQLGKFSDQAHLGVMSFRARPEQSAPPSPDEE